MVFSSSEPPMLTAAAATIPHVPRVTPRSGVVAPAVAIVMATAATTIAICAHNRQPPPPRGMTVMVIRVPGRGLILRHHSAGTFSSPISTTAKGSIARSGSAASTIAASVMPAGISRSYRTVENGARKAAT